MHDPVNLRLHVLIASLSEAVLVEDEHRRISLTNGAFCRMFGIKVKGKLDELAVCHVDTGDANKAGK